MPFRSTSSGKTEYMLAIDLQTKLNEMKANVIARTEALMITRNDIKDKVERKLVENQAWNLWCGLLAWNANSIISRNQRLGPILFFMDSSDSNAPYIATHWGEMEKHLMCAAEIMALPKADLAWSFKKLRSICEKAPFIKESQKLILSGTMVESVRSIWDLFFYQQIKDDVFVVAVKDMARLMESVQENDFFSRLCECYKKVSGSQAWKQQSLLGDGRPLDKNALMSRQILLQYKIFK